MGPVVKRDVMKASVMLEHELKYAVILAFDVKVERDAQEMADSLGVKIFQVNVYSCLFHLQTKLQLGFGFKSRPIVCPYIDS